MTLEKLPGSQATKLLFDHTRNYMTCAALFAAGMLARSHTTSDWLPDWLAQGAGWGMILMAIAFALLNLLEGVRHLSRLNHPRLLIAALVIAYVIFSARILTLVTAVRLVALPAK